MASKTLLPSSNGNATGPPPRTPSLSPLARQASIYSLTFDEFQNAMHDPGKTLGSMNMDEFLRNIWTAEESQAMAAAMANVGDANAASSTGIACQPSLPRQASVSLPQSLISKTVDDVWRDIHRNSEQSSVNKIQQRQPTMGEMTLEDFLAKAGVVREENEAGQSANSSNGVVAYSPAIGASRANNVQPTGIPGINAQSAAAQQVDWINYQLKTASALQQEQQHQLLQQQQQLLQQHHQQQQQQAEAAAAYAGRLVAPAPIAFSSSPTADVLEMPFNGAAPLGLGGLSLSPAILNSDAPARGKKRMLESSEGKVVEQRQRRMIKNRESAARSRARKQAYTVELEEEVTQLKEENSRLKQQQAEVAEKRRKQITETLIPVTEQCPKHERVLRRTRTASW